MYLRLFLLCITGSALLYGQAPEPAHAVPAAIQELRNQVAAGFAPRAKLQQAEEEFAAAQDAELLSAPVSLNDLTEEQAARLQEAAQRQLDRGKARLEQARALVDAGLVPAQTLAAPTSELALAQSSYDLVLSRTELVHQMAQMARTEQEALEAPHEEFGINPPVMVRFDGDGSFTAADLYHVKDAFEQQFHKSLPISADGETAVHRSMGFDHRGRVDVAIIPDTAEGVWLRHFLEASSIPYYAFRTEVPGKATGAHIHIGPPSTRIASTGKLGLRPPGSLD